MKRRAAWVAGALVVAALAAALAVVGLASYGRARDLVHHRGTRPPGVSPADSGLTYETVPFAAIDGMKLEGWWIVPKDGVRRRDLATVILCHPEDDSFAVATGLSGKARALPVATALARAGFIVLAFDFRSYGGSSGQATTGGYLERKDLAGAIEFAAARSLGAPMVLWGQGMGATVALEAGAEAGQAGAGVVQVLVEDPRETWNEALLDRALPAAGGAPWARPFAAAPLVRLFVAREIRGQFDGDHSRFGGALHSAPDSSLVVLPSITGSTGPGSSYAHLRGLIEGHLESLAAERARESTRARADSVDRAAGRVDSVQVFMGRM